MSTPWRMEFHHASVVAADVVECEREVLFHWYGNTETDIAQAYGPYLEQTVFLSVRRTDGDAVVAFARLIVPGPTRVKTFADLARSPWSVDVDRCLGAAGVDEARTWDIATLGSRPGSYEGRALAGMAVYHGILLTLRVNHAQTLVAIVDPRVRRLLAGAGLTCHNLPGAWPAIYLGSADSVPVYAHVAATIDEQRRLNPDAHRLITMGAGLTDVAIPGREALTWPLASDRRPGAQSIALPGPASDRHPSLIELPREQDASPAAER